ncbi:family 1 glycosylhydrolase [Streptomyces sp. HGB0020]|uniref:family 1 glycosylhydrolase n=1 Tax=unclassified Streptomyces TaxID=2593676 RepID=UPI0003A80F01
MENFAWAYGHDKRFGLVHADHRTQVRTINGIEYRYADIVRTDCNRSRRAA